MPSVARRWAKAIVSAIGPTPLTTTIRASPSLARFRAVSCQRHLTDHIGRHWQHQSRRGRDEFSRLLAPAASLLLVVDGVEESGILLLPRSSSQPQRIEKERDRRDDGEEQVGLPRVNCYRHVIRSRLEGLRRVNHSHAGATALGAGAGSALARPGASLAVLSHSRHRHSLRALPQV